MAEPINLRQARKRAERKKEDARAEENRVRHGQSKAVRTLKRAEQNKAVRNLEAHRLVREDE